MTSDQFEQLVALLSPDAPELHMFWLQLSGIIFAGIGLIFAGWQIMQLSRQLSVANREFHADHDRTRRENVISALRYYSDGTKPEHNKMVQLLDRMSEEQLINLWEARPVTLQGELKEFACSALRKDFPDAYDRYCLKRDEAAQFTHGESMQLRYIMLNVVNHYEICLVPWHLGIADEAAMEEQFKALVDKKDGKHKLDAARSIIGRERFPASEAFKHKLFPAGASISPARSQIGGAS